MSQKTSEKEDEASESTFHVSATACYSGVEVDAESAEDAIDQARREIIEALKSGRFQLTEIEAQEWHGDGYDLWEA